MRRKIITLLVLLLISAHAAQARSYVATLCSSCAFGSRKDECILCGRVTFGHGVMARLCSSCGFGSRSRECVRCGRSTFGHGVPAVLCRDCSFGDRKNRCVKCGGYL